MHDGTDQHGAMPCPPERNRVLLRMRWNQSNFGSNSEGGTYENNIEWKYSNWAEFCSCWRNVKGSTLSFFPRARNIEILESILNEEHLFHVLHRHQYSNHQHFLRRRRGAAIRSVSLSHSTLEENRWCHSVSQWIKSADGCISANAENDRVSSEKTFLEWKSWKMIFAIRWVINGWVTSLYFL